MKHPFTISPKEWEKIYAVSTPMLMAYAGEVVQNHFCLAKFVPYWNDFTLRTVTQYVEKQIGGHGNFVARVTRSVCRGRGISVKQGSPDYDDFPYILRACRSGAVWLYTVEHETVANQLRSRNGTTPRGPIAVQVIHVKEGFLVFWKDGEQLDEIIEHIMGAQKWEF